MASSIAEKRRPTNKSPASKIVELNRSKCIICYGPNCSELGPATAVPVEELSPIFSKCLDANMPEEFFGYGTFHFCPKCLPLLTDLETVFEKYVAIEKEFNLVRSKVAEQVVESVKRSNYLDNNRNDGNAFDATRSQIFTRWVSRVGKKRQLSINSEKSGLLSIDKTGQGSKSTNRELQAVEEPIRPRPLQSTNLKRSMNSLSLIRHPSRNSSSSSSIRISKVESLSTESTTAMISRNPTIPRSSTPNLKTQKIGSNIVVGFKTIGIGGIPKAPQRASTSPSGNRNINQKITVYPKAIRKSPVLGSIGNTNPRTLNATVLGSKNHQNGMSIATTNGSSSLPVYTSNKIDREAATFAAQAIVLSTNDNIQDQSDVPQVSCSSNCEDLELNLQPSPSTVSVPPSSSNSTTESVPAITQRPSTKRKVPVLFEAPKPGQKVNLDEGMLKIKRCPLTGIITHVLDPDHRFANVDIEEEDGTLTLTSRTGDDIKTFRIKPKPPRQSKNKAKALKHRVKTSSHSHSPPKLERMDTPRAQTSVKTYGKPVPSRESGETMKASSEVVQEQNKTNKSAEVPNASPECKNASPSSQIQLGETSIETASPEKPRTSDIVNNAEEKSNNTFGRITGRRGSLTMKIQLGKNVVDTVSPENPGTSQIVKNVDEKHNTPLRISGRSGRAIKRPCPFGDSETWVDEGEIDKIVAEQEAAHGRHVRGKIPKRSDEAKEKNPSRQRKSSVQSPEKSNLNEEEGKLIIDEAEDLADRNEVEQHEQSSEGDNTDGLMYQCEVCLDSSNIFSTKDELLKHHNQKHDSGNIFTSTIGTDTFSTKRDPSKHVDLNLDRQRKCRICGHTANTKKDFDQHELTHLEEEYHKCEHCYMAFASLQLLVQHQIKKHAQQQAHRCDRCLELFKDMDSLREHQRIQMNAEQKSCHICNEKFSWICSLNLHVKGHGKSFVMKCTICQDTLTSLAEWEKHQASAHTVQMDV